MPRKEVLLFFPVGGAVGRPAPGYTASKLQTQNLNPNQIPRPMFFNHTSPLAPNRKPETQSLFCAVFQHISHKVGEEAYSWAFKDPKNLL